MEKNITIKFPEDKLRALDVYIKRKGSSMEKEMAGAAQLLYEKVVPNQVRDYLDEIAGRSKTAEKGIANANNKNN